MVLSQAKFTFNRLKNHTTKKSLFEIVYGKNHNNTLDLTQISLVRRTSDKAEDLADHIKSIHEQIHQQIETSNAKHKESAVWCLK